MTASKKMRPWEGRSRPEGERMADHLKHFAAPEGVVFVGKAQEKTPVFRTEKRRHLERGRCYPGIVKSTALVNPYYFYGLDRHFGPFFLKFCSDALSERPRIPEAPTAQGRDRLPSLGILSGADPQRLQALGDELSGEKIEGLLEKGRRRWPHPLTPSDPEAGYRYDLSIRQAESPRACAHPGERTRPGFHESFHRSYEIAGARRPPRRRGHGLPQVFWKETPLLPWQAGKRKRSDTCDPCLQPSRSHAGQESGPHGVLGSYRLRLLDHRPEGQLPPCALHERVGRSHPFSSPQTELILHCFVGLRRSLVSDCLVARVFVFKGKSTGSCACW
jgi:hypothetical protein